MGASPNLKCIHISPTSCADHDTPEGIQVMAAVGELGAKLRSDTMCSRTGGPRA